MRWDTLNRVVPPWGDGEESERTNKKRRESSVKAGKLEFTEDKFFFLMIYEKNMKKKI
jgi:hypothetical protein